MEQHNFNFESTEQHLFNFHFGLHNAPAPIQHEEPKPEPEPFEKIETDGKTKFRCNIENCGKIFKFKSEMSRHLVIHFNDRPYVCPHEGCKKAFKRSDALDNHVRIHTKEMPYTCEAPGCGLKFTTKAGLRYHVMKHNEQPQKPFECPFHACTETFATSSQLQEHGKTHQIVSNKRPLTFVEEPVPTKMVSYKKDQFDLGEGYNNEFFNPAPRPAQVMEWEVRNQEDSEKFANKKVNEDYERIMKTILQENRVLKQKLEAYNTKLSDLEEAEQEIRKPQMMYFQPPVSVQAPVQFVQKEEPSFFFDDSETRFLDFLKGNDSFDF